MDQLLTDYFINLVVDGLTGPWFCDSHQDDLDCPEKVWCMASDCVKNKITMDMAKRDFSFYNHQAIKKVNVTIRDGLPLLASEMFSILDTGKVWPLTSQSSLSSFSYWPFKQNEYIFWVQVVLNNWATGRFATMQYPTPVQQIHHHHMTRLIFDDIKIPEVISDDISSDYIFWGSLVTVIRWHIFSGQRWPAMLFTSPTTEPWRPSHRGNQLQGSVYKRQVWF